MITFKEFKEIIEKYQNFSGELSKYLDLKIDLYDTKIVWFAENILDKYLNLIFTEEGVDWIYWWLFERELSSDPAAWDENGNVVPSETIEDLWNIVKEYFK